MKRMHKQKYQKDLPSEFHKEPILKITLKLDGFLRRQFQNNDPAMFNLIKLCGLFQLGVDGFHLLVYRRT